jgi:hypothetical protein
MVATPAAATPTPYNYRLLLLSDGRSYRGTSKYIYTNTGSALFSFLGIFFSYLDDKKIVMENNSNRLLIFGRRPDFHSAGQAKKCFDPFCLKITTTKSTQTNEDYIKKTKTPAAI